MRRCSNTGGSGLSRYSLRSISAVRGLADLDAMAAPPGIALAGELRMQGELEIGQSIERDAGGDELLAGGRDQLAGVGDAIGFGDEPARQRIAVDAVGISSSMARS